MLLLVMFGFWGQVEIWLVRHLFCLHERREFADLRYHYETLMGLTASLLNGSVREGKELGARVCECACACARVCTRVCVNISFEIWNSLLIMITKEKIDEVADDIREIKSWPCHLSGITCFVFRVKVIWVGHNPSRCLVRRQKHQTLTRNMFFLNNNNNNGTRKDSNFPQHFLSVKLYGRNNAYSNMLIF